MIDGLFKAARQLTGTAAKIVVSVAVGAVIAIGAGAMVIYEGVSYGLNYTGELVARARLAVNEMGDKRDAKSALVNTAQKKGILQSDKPLTKYQDCVVDQAANAYASKMGEARTGKHIQRSPVFLENVATFKTVVDPSTSPKLAKIFPANGSVVARFGSCETLTDPAVDVAVNSARLRNMAGYLTQTGLFQAAAQKESSSGFELSGQALIKDQYAQFLVPPLSRQNVSADNLDDLIENVSSLDSMRSSGQSAGRFYYSTQVRGLKAAPVYSRLDDPQKATLATILNFSANLPKHQSQVIDEMLAAERLKQEQKRQARLAWEDAEITRVTNEEWKTAKQNSPEMLNARRLLMQPVPPETMALLGVNIEDARRKYAGEMASFEAKLQEQTNREYLSFRRGVEERLRKNWAQSGTPQVSP